MPRNQITVIRMIGMKSKIGSKIVEYQQQQEPDEGIKQYFHAIFNGASI